MVTGNFDTWLVFVLYKLCRSTECNPGPGSIIRATRAVLKWRLHCFWVFCPVYFFRFLYICVYVHYRFFFSNRQVYLCICKHVFSRMLTYICIHIWIMTQSVWGRISAGPASRMTLVSLGLYAEYGRGRCSFYTQGTEDTWTGWLLSLNFCIKRLIELFEYNIHRHIQNFTCKADNVCYDIHLLILFLKAPT